MKKSWMSIRKIEHQDLKVWNWKEKEKLKEHKRCRPAKRKIYKQIKISDMSAGGTTTKKYQFLYWTKTTKKKYKFLNWKLYIATLNINSMKG